MSSTLPQDMIIDILTRLPVTSISGFKCVCKSWHDLFNDIQFRKLHYDRINIQKKSNLIKIIAGKGNDLYSIDVYDSGKVSEVVKIVDYPFYNEKYREFDDNLGILGSCNGLVCIRPRFDLICFWNPSTKDHRIVSKVQQTETPSSWCRFGFGYDLNTQDYRLVSFERFMDERRGSQIMVYSLASNSWSTTPYNMPYTLACRARPTSLYFNEALHWLTDDSKVLVGILPGDRGNVWVMEEYGVRESWTKRFTVT
ncbi:F-box/kelch-repeat protein At3g06240-like [Papaver somniferum]|uniref:F-box/kelch-repeat protein At3g06240-like n=1 Tax=Papaver somniferum TaxID=3469 RepID=UPI000E6F4775|nr:F-box/kelch-repeat protein At3g06240-like [Papaver somniferum]